MFSPVQGNFEPAPHLLRGKHQVDHGSEPPRPLGLFLAVAPFLGTDKSRSPARDTIASPRRRAIHAELGVPVTLSRFEKDAMIGGAAPRQHLYARDQIIASSADRFAGQTYIFSWLEG
jgi:hypothetical protein